MFLSRSPDDDMMYVLQLQADGYQYTSFSLFTVSLLGFRMYPRSQTPEGYCSFDMALYMLRTVLRSLRRFLPRLLAQLSQFFNDHYTYPFLYVTNIAIFIGLLLRNAM